MLAFSAPGDSLITRDLSCEIGHQIDLKREHLNNSLDVCSSEDLSFSMSDCDFKSLNSSSSGECAAYTPKNQSPKIQTPKIDILSGISFDDILIQIKNIEKSNNLSEFHKKEYIQRIIDRKIEYDIEGKLAVSYLRERGVTYDQIQGYNYMIEVQIPKIITSSTIRADDATHFKFTDIRVVPSNLMPQQARDKGLSYLLKITARVEHCKNDGELIFSDPNQVEIAQLPIVMGSNYDNLKLRNCLPDELLKYGECIHDPGGYSMYNGKQKLILWQEKLRANRVLIYKEKKSYICGINCITLKGSRPIKLIYDAHCLSIKLNMQEFAGEKDSINVFQIFRLLDKKWINGECQTGTSSIEEIIAYILQFVRPEWKNMILMLLQGTRFELINKDKERNDKIQNDYDDIYVRNLYTTKFVKKQKENNVILKGADRVKYVDNVISEFLFPQISPNDVHDHDDRILLNESKKMLLGLMTARYAEYLAGLRTEDDRDRWKNKRIVGSGFMIRQLFRVLWEKFVDKVNKEIKHKNKVNCDQIRNFVSNNAFNKITSEISTSYTSGKWGASKKSKQDNVTEDTDFGESVLSYLSQTTKITVQTKKKAKNPKARRVQPDQFPVICALNTTSGEGVGLIKYKAIGCEVSIETDENVILERIIGKNYNSGLSILSSVKTDTHSSICMVNAKPKGWCDGDKLYNYLRTMRLKGKIDYTVGLFHEKEDNLFSIYTDGDRLMSPFIIVGKDNIPLININNNSERSFTDLMDNGVIEWLDMVEAKNHAHVCQSLGELNKINQQKEMLRYSVASMMDAEQDQGKMNDVEKVEKVKNLKVETAILLARLELKKYTHVSVNPNLNFGVAASIIPYITNNPAPRNAFQAGMVMQAMASNHSNNAIHFPTTGRISINPTPPIASTEMHASFALDSLPAGNTLICAVMTTGKVTRGGKSMPWGATKEDGSNEEDGVTVNQAAIDRGLFRYNVCHSYGTIVTKADTLTNSMRIEERTYRPKEPLPSHKLSNYQFLDNNGIIRAGSPVQAGDCLVCKIRIKSVSVKTPNGKNKSNFNELEREDSSLYVDRYQDGVVDTVTITELDNGNKVINIKVSKYGSPTKQDKVATRQAQKSTIGSIVPASMMPYTKDGVTPDIIINPHALPKRMTIATLIEIITSKFGALAGELVNASAFKDFGGVIEDIGQLLEIMYGFNKDGTEKLYYMSGDEILSCNVMIGPIYYQLLKHQVSAKYQVRGVGQRDLVRRLPTQGRKKNGGGRCGEQEVWGMLAHGAVNMINDRTSKLCDPVKNILCQTCSNIATVDSTRQKITCNNCSNVGVDMGDSKFVVDNGVWTFNVFAYYASILGIKVNPIFGEKFDTDGLLEEDELDSDCEDEDGEEEDSDEEDLNYL